jgi:hemoglobin-like flavoprotein
MAMTLDQITLVQQSFGKVAPIADQAATLFYGRLFELAPQVKPLFPVDMTEQRKKLMMTLATVIGSLNDLPAVLPSASALAKRHVAYGVKPEHYAIVGGALLWTLERGLGADWTKDLAAAWTATYAALADFMIGEAYGRSTAAE